MQFKLQKSILLWYNLKNKYILHPLSMGSWHLQIIDFKHFAHYVKFFLVNFNNIIF